MKYYIYLLPLLFSIFSCKKYDDNTVTLLETNKYIVYASKDDFKRVFEKWLKVDKNDSNFQKDEEGLYAEIHNHYNDIPVNAYKIAKRKNRLNRLEYHTAFLLQTNQAFVYNKLSKKIEKIKVEKTDDQRTFFVKDTIILKVIDKIY